MALRVIREDDENTIHDLISKMRDRLRSSWLALEVKQIELSTSHDPKYYELSFPLDTKLKSDFRVTIYPDDKYPVNTYIGYWNPDYARLEELDIHTVAEFNRMSPLLKSLDPLAYAILNNVVDVLKSEKFIA